MVRIELKLGEQTRSDEVVAVPTPGSKFAYGDKGIPVYDVRDVVYRSANQPPVVVLSTPESDLLAKGEEKWNSYMAVADTNPTMAATVGPKMIAWYNELSTTGYVKMAVSPDHFKTLLGDRKTDAVTKVLQPIFDELRARASFPSDA